MSVKQVVIELLMFATLLDLTLLFGQAHLSTSSPQNGDQSLRITKIGEGYMFGRHAAFRTYETPDHAEALIWYGEFRSEEESKLATELSLKEHQITGMEYVKDVNGNVIGDRIVAAPKDEKKAFMVIRRQGPNYWIIQSISLAVAMRVDELIEPPLPAAFAENPSSCDRSSELLLKQQVSKEEQKRVNQVRGMVAIVISADGDVVGAKAISARRPSDGNEAALSSAEAVDVLPFQARSMKFKSRPGCGDFRYVLSF
ncbi:MAG: hypothetical protein ABSB14_04790 [Candidatus Sulfotelmatobacter sp.]